MPDDFKWYDFHIFTHNMAVMYALIAVEFLVVLLFVPIRVRASGHASLERGSILLDLAVYGVVIVRVRIENDGGRFVVKVNGKEARSKGSVKISKVLSVMKGIEPANVAIRGNMLALLGTQDAMSSAILHSLAENIISPIEKALSPSGVVRIFGTASDALEMDGQVSARLTVLQMFELL